MPFVLKEKGKDTV